MGKGEGEKGRGRKLRASRYPQVYLKMPAAARAGARQKPGVWNLSCLLLCQQGPNYQSRKPE